MKWLKRTLDFIHNRRQPVSYFGVHGNIGDTLIMQGVYFNMVDVFGEHMWVPSDTVAEMISSEERGDKRYVLLAYVGKNVRKLEHLGSTTLVKIYHFRTGDERFAIMKDGDEYVITNLFYVRVDADDNRVEMDPEHTWVFPTWEAAVATARLEMRT